MKNGKKNLKKKRTELKTDYDPEELPKIKSGSVINKPQYKGLNWWSKKKFETDPETTYLVEIMFSNGTCKEFVIKTKEETFEYMKRTYYLRYQNARYSINNRQMKFFYHDDTSVPIDMKVHMRDDPSVDDPDQKKVFFAVSPHNLKELMRMKYVEALASANDLSTYLKIILILSGVSALGIAVMVLSKLSGYGG